MSHQLKCQQSRTTRLNRGGKSPRPSQAVLNCRVVALNRQQWLMAGLSVLSKQKTRDGLPQRVWEGGKLICPERPAGWAVEVSVSGQLWAFHTHTCKHTLNKTHAWLDLRKRSNKHRYIDGYAHSHAVDMGWLCTCAEWSYEHTLDACKPDNCCH